MGKDGYVVDLSIVCGAEGFNAYGYVVDLYVGVLSCCS
jgi:hypothetical protein